MQIAYGLLCAADGCPVAAEVFEGNTGDPKTLAAQIEQLKQCFNLDWVVLVGAASVQNAPEFHYLVIGKRVGSRRAAALAHAF